MSEPKILFWDIETSLMEAHIWGLGQQFISKEQLIKDWHLMAWAAKWLGDPPSKIMYMDQRKARDLENDKALVSALRDLLDEADMVVTQNGKRFDQPRINARIEIHKLEQPSSYKHEDTCRIAAGKFGFTSNSLDYLSNKLDLKYKKLKHGKFPGNELWKECAKGNSEAWDEMERYNKNDVLALEELYKRLIPWSGRQPLAVFSQECTCDKPNIIKKGTTATEVGVFQRYKCTNCGSPSRGSKNLLTREQKEIMRRGIGK